MRELRTCDFCGADAVGTFAIVPPELEPTETEQRRVVLCPDCKTQLEELIAPLLARAGAETGADGSDEPSETTAGSRDGSRERRRSSADESTEPDESDDPDGDDSGSAVAADESTRTRSRSSSPNAAGSETRAESASGNADADSDIDSSTDAGPQIGSGLEGGITFDRSGSGATDGEKTAADDADESPSRPPQGYGKVVRLLQNREFPMQRAAVENLAAGAYDLESHEVDAIIDHALEDGKFVENRGKLQRPDN